MRMRQLKSAMALVMVSLLSVWAASCSPDVPTNEKKNKLHEDPVKAVFTLQEGKLDDLAKFDSDPRMANFTASSTPAQVVVWETTAARGWHVTSPAKGFKVKNVKDNPNVVYALRIDYYNAKGEKMNQQFYDLGQDKIHQHFFSMYREFEFGGSKGMARVTDKSKLPFDYRYADERNGVFMGKDNPMGFEGLMRFVRPGERFSLSVELLHAAKSKFGDNNKLSPFYAPANVLVSTGQWDIVVKLPVEVDGAPAKSNEVAKLGDFAPTKAVVVFYEGHLHGTFAFHQNPHSKQNKYLGANYKLVYELRNGQWRPADGNAKTVNLIGSKDKYCVTGVAIRYYDSHGNDITGKLMSDGEDRRCQHFFTVSDIEPSYGGKKEKTDVNGPGFFDYVYCDTTPWDKSNKFDGAKFTGDKNPVGLKGYFTFLHSHKRFLLNIKLMRAKVAKDAEGKASPFYAPTKRQQVDEDWMPTIAIPVNVYMDWEEKELDADFDSMDLSSPALDEKSFSERDRERVHSLMNAFGLADFKAGLAEFFWNLKGSAKHDNSGFWF